MDFDSSATPGCPSVQALCWSAMRIPVLVDLARVILRFFRNESCGKCTPAASAPCSCTRIVSRIAEGQGTLADLDAMVRISEAMSEVSIAALGRPHRPPCSIS